MWTLQPRSLAPASAPGPPCTSSERAVQAGGAVCQPSWPGAAPAATVLRSRAQQLPAPALPAGATACLARCGTSVRRRTQAAGLHAARPLVFAGRLRLLGFLQLARLQPLALCHACCCRPGPKLWGGQQLWEPPFCAGTGGRRACCPLVGRAAGGLAAPAGSLKHSLLPRVPRHAACRRQRVGHAADQQQRPGDRSHSGPRQVRHRSRPLPLNAGSPAAAGACLAPRLTPLSAHLPACPPACAVTQCSWRATGGVLDFFILAGPTPLDVLDQLTAVVGRPAMMPRWALGWHQCKYGERGAACVRAARTAGNQRSSHRSTSRERVQMSAIGVLPSAEDPHCLPPPLCLPLPPRQATARCGRWRRWWPTTARRGCRWRCCGPT